MRREYLGETEYDARYRQNPRDHRCGFRSRGAACLPTLFPELQELISGGSEAAEAMLAKFDTPPSFDQDDNLFLLAYALEQMNYTASLGRLVSFLEENITGEVPVSLAAVTHAVRRMIGLPLNDSAAYLASEIEETIELAGEELASSSRVNPETLRKSCWRQFVLVDADDHPLVYPAGHPKAGQIITVGGTIYPADTTIPDGRASGQEPLRAGHESGDTPAGGRPGGGPRRHLQVPQRGGVQPPALL